MASENEDRSVIGYKKMLDGAKELKRQCIEKLAMRARILIAVFEDENFRQKAGIGEQTIINRLNRYLEDYGVTLPEMIEVMKVFPEPELWGGKSIRAVYAEAMEVQKRGMQPCELPKEHVRNNVALSEYTIAMARTEIAWLRNENKSLRMENRRLKNLPGRLTKMAPKHSRVDEPLEHGDADDE